MKSTTLIFVLALAAPAAAGLAPRLPAGVTPEHYDLSFTPDLRGATFAGEETIAAHVGAPTDAITINAVDITFQSVEIASGRNTQHANVTIDKAAQTATFSVSTPIPAGPTTIRVRFTGVLNEQLRGFYLSKGKGRNYAVTQFEATDARRAFPCFDEPAMKATFSISLIIDRDDTAISNGSVVADTRGPGESKHTVKFATSPRMSSYLVAMAVGDWQCQEESADNIPIRVCATPDKVRLGRLALESAEHTLQFYNRYFDIKYPFKKLDVLAVPDFAAGAMENTAAIFYRESDLLADEKTAPVGTRKSIAGILAHEMAHQWFGDLVTMNWWNDLWLNEGFANWMETKPVATWKPEWHEDADEVLDNEAALSLDSLRSTHPIRVNVQSPAEIDEVFDTITYNKGAAVLRMIEAYVGPEVFRAGVNSYLKQHAYSNATAEDFWNAITAVSHKPVDTIMPTFVDRPGAPLLSVETRCVNVDGGASRQAAELTISQRRFFLDERLFDEGSAESWQIPVCFKAPGSDAPTCVVLTQLRQTFQVANCAPWVFVNAGAQGYYRSEYPPPVVRALARSITAFTGLERTTLLSDEWALVRLGRQPVADYFALAEGLKSDRSRAVIQTLDNTLEYIGDYLITDAERPRFQAWVRDLLKPALTDVGWTGVPREEDDRKSLRADLIHALGYTGRDPEVLAHAADAVQQYLQNSPMADATLAGTWVSLAALNGDARLYDEYLARTRTATSPVEYDRYLYALAEFTDSALLKRSLEHTLSTDLRTQDTAIFLARLLANPAARDLTWEFIKSHWTELENKVTIFGGDAGLVAAAGGFCDAKSRQDVEQFFTTRKLTSANRALAQTLERIDACIAVKKRQGKSLAEALREPTR